MEGNSERLVAADLNEFPLYARGGVPIPSQSYSPRMTTAPLTNLVVRCWPGADGAVQKSVFYEDDGVSNDYKKGKSASTALVYERKGNRIKITANPVQGTFAGQLQKREMSVELMGLAKPASATLNGKAVDFRYNAANGQVKVRVPERSIHESVVVTVVAEEASQEPMVAAAQKRRMAGVMGHPVEDWKAEMAKPDLTVGQRSALQAIRGYGLAKKNDAPYLFKGTEQFYLFAAKDSVIPSRVTLRMGGKQIGGEINQSVNISSQEPSLIEWPIKIEKTIEFEIPEAGKMQATDL